MSHGKRTIAVVTGTRAEFGILQPVMRQVGAHHRLHLKTIVAGAHLMTGTWKDVKNAGFAIDARIAMQKKDRVGRAADVDALGRGVVGFGRVFDEVKPDFVVVLGDRIEAFAAATAAAVGGYRVAHIHGGDRAEGVADESVRHAITKLSHVHFAATTKSKARIVRMGESPDSVFNTGSPAADGLKAVKPNPDAPDAIVLQHPIGASDAEEKRFMLATLEATTDLDRLIVAPNADPGSRGIRAALRSKRCKLIEHLPRDLWLQTLAGAKVIVGNSSAGLIEAAILKTPAVNVGPRQAGRERPRSVIDAPYDAKKIHLAVRKAMKMKLSSLRHPYGRGDASKKIADLLAKLPIVDIPIRKQNTY